MFIGLGNLPTESDGALVACTADGVTLTPEHVLDEQGCHEIVEIGGALLVPGTDPVDDWTLGNLYTRNGAGVWAKKRTLPLTIHCFGLYDDGAGHLFAGVGAHAGDSVTWEGRILRSDDGGTTWAVNVLVNDNRIYDVVGYNGALYATGQTQTGDYQLWKSIDLGVSWALAAGAQPESRPRLAVFGSLLVMVTAGRASLTVVNAVNSVTVYVTPFTIANQWNVLWVRSGWLYVIAADGYIWRSQDFSAWERYSYVSGALSLGLLPDNSIGIGAVGLWKVT